MLSLQCTCQVAHVQASGLARNLERGGQGRCPWEVLAPTVSLVSHARPGSTHPACSRPTDLRPHRHSLLLQDFLGSGDTQAAVGSGVWL